MQSPTASDDQAPIRLPGPDATDRVARFLASHVAAGDVLLLDGPVGAGKTHLARALIQTLLAQAGAPAEDIPSPTYTLVQTYRAGDLEIWHADLYRLTDPAEAAELGLEAAFGTALCLVEWPDRLGRDRPADALTLRLDHAEGGAARDLRLRPDGPRSAALAHKLARRTGRA